MAKKIVLPETPTFIASDIAIYSISSFQFVSAENLSQKRSMKGRKDSLG